MLRWLSVLLLLLAVPAVAQGTAERRVALVIGNASYRSASLRNPLNDARAMAAALRQLGFEVVTVENGGRKRMQAALREFRDKLSPDAVGLFYYSGHGMQVRGQNYLLPSDAQIKSEAEVDEEAVSLNALLGRLDEARNRLNIVILDACRDNPFERSFRSATRGLGQVDAPSGTLIAYATAPGQTASDGGGANGLYTTALLETMRIPGLQIEEVFKRVRARVQSETQRQQVPWESSSLTGNFAFLPGAAGALPPLALAPTPAPTPAVAAPPRLANPHDGSWQGTYHCGAAGSGNEPFDRPLRLLVSGGQAQFARRAARPDEPGAWSAVVSLAADGAVTMHGDGKGNGGQDLQIELTGRLEDGVARAAGHHGRRQCTLELKRAAD